MLATVILGNPDWLWPAGALAVSAVMLLVWCYLRSPGSAGVRIIAALLKTIAVLLLLFCLIDPLFSGRRPRPGANIFVILADDSQSMQIQNLDSTRSRLDDVKEHWSQEVSWQNRLARDFSVRRYRFAERLQAADTGQPEDLTGNGQASSLVTALRTVAQRFRAQPVAGILLLSDGNATDLPEESVDWSELPPVYPVQIGAAISAPDLRVDNIAVSQTNFEQAPVTIKATVTATGFRKERVIVQLLSDQGEELEQLTFDVSEEETNRIVRFQVRPETPGTSFFQVRVSTEDELSPSLALAGSRESCLLNNARWVAVDRPTGPYRVLYVSGRPNWELKFLRRALQRDGEMELVGLIRIAKREPKFTFLSRAGESTNPLYRGFDSVDAENAEQYDEPVIIRLGTRDEEELRGGFPQTAEELFAYHAIVLDDVEAEFFSQKQMLLMQNFVSARGGGLLMLGGAETLVQGGYDRTPVGEMLPVYLRTATANMSPPEAGYRLQLTRDGWLEPWIRLRETEDAERRRLEAMPPFQVVNRVSGIKPGATMMAEVVGQDREVLPALVAQRFGRGQTGTLLIGDLWRWTLRRPPEAESDSAKSWRQMIRWLVGNVPDRVELIARRNNQGHGGPLELSVEVRDAKFEPMDNAAVQINVQTPEGANHEMLAEPSNQTPGLYSINYGPHLPGAYRITTKVLDADGSLVGTKETGWVAEPAAAEFRQLTANRQLLGQIADSTDGELLQLDELDRFVRNLPNRKIPVTEPWVYPLWQTPWIFMLAIGCLVGEWGLRRWKGLP
jgi:uncharacterized membrane protein